MTLVWLSVKNSVTKKHVAASSSPNVNLSQAPDPGTPHNEARDQVWDALVEIVADLHDTGDVDGDGVEDEGVPVEALRRALERNGTLVEAFDRASGKRVWKHETPAEGELPEPGHPRNRYAGAMKAMVLNAPRQALAAEQRPLPQARGWLAQREEAIR